MRLQRLIWQRALTIAFHDDEVRWTSGRNGAIKEFGALPLPSGLVADGAITHPEAAGKVLAAAGVRANALTQVIIAVPAHRSVQRRIDIPARAGKQFGEMVEREIRREMPMLADNAYVSWARGDERDGQVAVLVIGIARDVLDSHTAAATAAGLRPYAADLRVIAAARAIGEANCIIALVEDGGLELGIFGRGIPAIIRSAGLPADADDAAWGDQLSAEIGRTLKFYRDSHREDDVISRTPISFAGAAAPRALLTADIAAATGHDVALPRLKIMPPREDDAPRFATNIGLALKELAA
jgi:Tfp pilus assembly PilM family ATPase